MLLRSFGAFVICGIPFLSFLGFLETNWSWLGWSLGRPPFEETSMYSILSHYLFIYIYINIICILYNVKSVLIIPTQLINPRAAGIVSSEIASELLLTSLGGWLINLKLVESWNQPLRCGDFMRDVWSFRIDSDRPHCASWNVPAFAGLYPAVMTRFASAVQDVT